MSHQEAARRARSRVRDRHPDGAQITLELQDFFARSHPTAQGIVPLLDRAELAAVLRRLDEQHGVHLDLATLSPGVASLAAALEEKCELGVLLAELSRDRLAKVCGHYALASDDTSREGYIRTILAAAAGITVDEARTIEAAPARPVEAEEDAPEPKPTARTNTAGYRAAIAALPRGVLHRGMLSVLVVHKRDGMPGQGFFKLAAELGRDAADPMKLWSEELKLVYRANARPR